MKGSHDQNLLQSIPSNIYYQLKKEQKKYALAVSS